VRAAASADRSEMDSGARAGARTNRLWLFWLFALFVIARQVIDLAEYFVRVVFDEVAYDASIRYGDLVESLYLLLVIVAVCAALHSWRRAIVRSDLAPFHAVLAFAFLLPAIRQLLADGVIVAGVLAYSGSVESPRGLERLVRGEPLQMIWYILLGIGAACVWDLVLRRIFGGDVQAVVRRGLSPPSGIWLLLPFLLFATALPALTGLAAWLLPVYSHSFPDLYDLYYPLLICAVALCLFASRGAIARSELAPACMVLAFMLLMQFVFNVIDREILHLARHYSKLQMPWEDSLPLRTSLNYIWRAAYLVAVNLVAVAAVCGIFLLVFGRDPAAVMRRVERAAPEDGATVRRDPGR
jgi:hypothetical protein